jgi:hypothetical protein
VTGTSADRAGPGGAPSVESSGVPERAGLVLGSLIAVAAVANLGLAVANVAPTLRGAALPSSR